MVPSGMTGRSSREGVGGAKMEPPTPRIARFDSTRRGQGILAQGSVCSIAG